MIVLHFAFFLFAPLPGHTGTIASLAGTIALVWAGILFMWAAVPYHNTLSSRWMLVALIAANALYLAVSTFFPDSHPLLNSAALLLGILPLSITLVSARTLNAPLRWFTTGLYCALSAFLLAFQNRPGDGSDLALNALLFVVYIGCSIHFWYTYRRATAGSLITIAGFLAWAAVFVVAPWIGVAFPHKHIQDEVWNLPKYVVAVGMILLLLEDQIEHNKHLALHDELTGLPNRRLFQDRLSSALERARRTGAQMALLLVDLNHFKQVNDTYGHHVGDQLLIDVGKLFLGRVRRSDTVARTGGDEFSLILEEPICREDAQRVADSLMQRLDSPIRLGEHTVRVGASVGVAIFPDDALSAESLCIAADIRMYSDKNTSRPPAAPPAFSKAGEPYTAPAGADSSAQ